MVGESYFQVDLFSALVRELGKCDKQWLAMHLAEILASRVSLVAELNHDGASRGPVELAQQLIQDMSWKPAPPSSRPKLTSSITTEKKAGGSKPTVVPRADDPKEIEAAKKAIRLRFESWRTVKRGRHWHVGFARKMIELYPCVARQRTIDVWVQEWESELRKETPFRIAKPGSREQTTKKS
jgi:hypothetical protein